VPVSTTPDRIVDAHVHLWDPARSDWYPYLGGGQDLGMGDVTGMARRFDAATYRAEAGSWNVEKLVNVAAATGRHSVAETLELDRLADSGDGPAAIIGGLPAADSAAEAIALIDEQCAATRFRGVRPMNPKGPPVPDDEVLVALAERELVFELMAHPPALAAAKRELERFLFDEVYRSERVLAIRVPAQAKLADLFGWYLAHPESLPLRFRERAASCGVPRSTADYIAGMTDRFLELDHARRLGGG
jgi:hypothetical protein